MAVTPFKKLLSTGLGLGLGTRFHVRPSKARISGTPGAVEPTAQALRAEIAVTPSNVAPRRPRTGAADLPELP
jgi:hypothetical protein